MRTITITLLLFSCYATMGQVYDQVIISEGKKPDEDNKVFVQGNALTYSVESTSEELDLPEKVIYTVLALPPKKRTIKNQTEVVITRIPDSKRLENTGIVENDSNLWIHPPRTGVFNILETCPFPYVKFPITENTVWEDQVSVGDQWSQGMWKGRMLFNIKYKVIGKKQIEMDNIRFDCWVIEGVANSSVGSTKTIITYHEDEGFIELAFTTLKGEALTFKLESIVQGPIFKTMSDYFAEKLNSPNQK